eukprot:c57200_g1_i1 orf=28-216(+)
MPTKLQTSHIISKIFYKIRSIAYHSIASSITQAKENKVKLSRSAQKKQAQQVLIEQSISLHI